MSTRVCNFALLASVLLLESCFEEKTFHDNLPMDQDINASESPVADQAIGILLQHENVQMVMCRRNGQYEVHAREGVLHFERRREASGYVYAITKLEGTNPLGNQDAEHLANLGTELAAGENPMSTDYSDRDPGYMGPTDPRIAFFPHERISYPLAYQRIAAMFDGPNAGDLVVEFTPWGWFPLGTHDGKETPGAHGQLNVVSSRAPLVFAGKGVKHGVQLPTFARSTDIAPTIAHVLGISKTFGIDEAGRYTHDNYLKWQDGHVLTDVLDGTKASRAVIIVNDAMTHSEIMDRLASGEDLPAYRWLVENGTTLGYGAITNFPSNTFASHNTIGSSAWSGHHGLIDNWFYDRVKKSRHDPLTEIFDTGRYMVDEVETLHEAVHRSFDNWHPETNPLGNFTVSIGTPSTRGADHALIEGIRPIDWDLCPEPPGLNLPPEDPTISGRAQGADNLTATIFAKVVLGEREVDGETVRCAHPPRYAIMNFGLTDDVAHETGPHSDGLRRAIVQTNRRMQMVMDVLRRAGMFDDTLFVFTSDHGQCLQDVQRHRDFKPALEEAGIRFVATNAFIYLLTVGVELEGDLARGENNSLTITVKDDDTKAPVSGATVTVRSGSSERTGTTNADGKVSFDFTPNSDSTTVSVESATHTRFEQAFANED